MTTGLRHLDRKHGEQIATDDLWCKRARYRGSVASIHRSRANCKAAPSMAALGCSINWFAAGVVGPGVFRAACAAQNGCSSAVMRMRRGAMKRVDRHKSRSPGGAGPLVSAARPSVGSSDVRASAGIFVTFGHAVHPTGPAVCLSFIIAAVGSIFSALCYAEIAARSPHATRLGRWAGPREAPSRSSAARVGGFIALSPGAHSSMCELAEVAQPRFSDLHSDSASILVRSACIL